MKLDDFLSLSGGYAIGLIVSATVGSACFYLLLALKIILPFRKVHPPTTTPVHVSYI